MMVTPTIRNSPPSARVPDHDHSAQIGAVLVGGAAQHLHAEVATDPKICASRPLRSRAGVTARRSARPRRPAREDASSGRRRAVFLGAGYAATAMSAVAADSRVSVQAVYKTFGNKALLAKAVVDAALSGDELVPAPERAARVSRHESDPRRRLRAFGDFVAEVAPRVAP